MVKDLVGSGGNGWRVVYKWREDGGEGGRVNGRMSEDLVGKREGEWSGGVER